MRIRPLSDRVVIRKDAPKDKTEGGVLLPESAQETAKTATVLTVGPGRRGEDGEFIPMSITAGNKVLVSSLAGTSFIVPPREELFILREDDILGIIE